MPDHCYLRQAVDYETDGCCHDLLGNLGFLFAVRQVLRVKEGGLGYWGLPCNSFSFMARSLHQRSTSQPFGCNHYQFVVTGNILACRMVALLMLCICRQVKFMVEQPDRSAAAIFPTCNIFYHFHKLILSESSGDLFSILAMWFWDYDIQYILLFICPMLKLYMPHSYSTWHWTLFRNLDTNK